MYCFCPLKICKIHIQQHSLEAAEYVYAVGLLSMDISVLEELFDDIYCESNALMLLNYVFYKIIDVMLELILMH